ncbi:MAG: DUF4330 domain-containing protein [Cyanobacteria bacterium]|nr:DUF4330 domain-containing protein [Cyanobacteriota bacterium]
MRKLNALDATILATLAASFIGFGLAKAGYAGVDQVIEGEQKVAIDIYIVGLKTKDTDIFKVGGKSAVTIRNRPVEPPMLIKNVQHWPHKASFLTPDGKSAVAFPDPAMPIAHDFVVTLEDQAERTADGFVIRGNKVKIGNAIELEGFKYRAQGVAVDIGPAASWKPAQP